ncbi:MAG: hypothetical protein WAV52_10505, partial [Luteococcus japonicus]
MNTLRSSFDELGHATWSLDLAVAGLLFVGTVLPMALFGYGNDVILALLLGTAMCAAVVLRRRNPMLALALVTVFCLLHVVVLPYPTPAIATVLLVAYSVARWVPGRRSRWVLGLGALG